MLSTGAETSRRAELGHLNHGGKRQGPRPSREGSRCPVFPEQGQFKGSMIVPNVEQNIHIRRVFHPAPIYRWGDGGLGFKRRSLFCLFVRNLPLTVAASFWGRGGWGRCTVIGRGQLGGSWCHAVRSTCRPSVLLGLTARPGKGTAALKCCGKGPEVQMDGWALLLSGYKVGKKIPIPAAFELTCPSFPPGRTRRGFRPTVRSWSRNCCQRSRSWSSSFRSRSGYVFVTASEPLALHSIFC